MCLENDHRLPTEQRFAPPIVEEAGNTPVLETVNNTTENPDTALDLNPRPIHFQRGALSGSAESLDTSADPSRDEDVEVMEVKPHINETSVYVWVRTNRAITTNTNF